MNILDELQLADIQLKKSGLVRVIYCLLTFMVIVGIEIGLYFYIFNIIEEVKTISVLPYATNDIYVENVSDGVYNLYSEYGGLWHVQMNVTESGLNYIKNMYSTTIAQGELISRRPNAIDLGLINHWHQLGYMLIGGVLLGLVLEPSMRRIQNKRDVDTYIQMYNMAANKERFDTETLSKIEEYQYLFMQQSSREVKWQIEFLSEVILTPQIAEKRKTISIKNNIKAKRAEEIKMVRESQKSHQSQKKAVISAETKIKAGIVKKIKSDYNQKMKDIDDLLTMKPVPSLVSSELNEKEKEAAQQINKNNKKLVQKRRKMLQNMRKLSSMMH